MIGKYRHGVNLELLKLSEFFSERRRRSQTGRGEDCKCRVEGPVEEDGKWLAEGQRDLPAQNQAD